MGEPPAKRGRFSDVQKDGLREWLTKELEDMEYPEETVKTVTSCLGGYTRKNIPDAPVQDLTEQIAKQLQDTAQAENIARALYNRIHPKQLPPATGHDHRTL
jgi:hypothetical protein